MSSGCLANRGCNRIRGHASGALGCVGPNKEQREHTGEAAEGKLVSNYSNNASLEIVTQPGSASEPKLLHIPLRPKSAKTA